MSDSTGIDKWIEFAKNDLLVARDLQLQKGYVYRAVLTHCQQSAEKYLKAFLLMFLTGLHKTHDLVFLNKKCNEFDSSFGSWNESLAWLSAIYIESRYPDDFEDIDKEDAMKALEIANGFEEFIKDKF